MQSLAPPMTSHRMKHQPDHVTNPDNCWAKAKSTGKQCKRVSMKDQHICDMHGGKSPGAIAKVSERQAAKRAETFLTAFDYGPLENPLDELMKLASEAVAAKDYFKSKIEELRYKGQTGEQLRSEVALWERAADRCLKILSEITRLGLAERVTRVREAETIMLGAALDRILDRLDLTPAQRIASETIVIEELEAITVSSDS